MGLISRVSSRTYRLNLIKIIMSANAVAASSAKPVAQPKGIYRHPYVWNGVAEVPGWLMARDVSPSGVWYSVKRAMMRSMTIHHSDRVAMHRFSFFQTKMLPAVAVFYYFLHYAPGHLDLQKNAKHHW